MTASRNLLPFALGRNRTETVILITYLPTPSEADDGSYSFFKREELSLARVVALSPNEIARFAMGGITLNRGISVAIVGELDKAPDKVQLENGELAKIIQHTIREGASVFICDIVPMGEDGVSYGSGYV